MKTIINILIFTLILTSAFKYDDYVNEIPQEILQALSNGDAEKLSEFLNDNVELVILEKESVYSRIQAKLILADFFAKNKPEKFFIILQGGKLDSKYAIGNLSTSIDIFRVYFSLKKYKEKYYIHQIRIEKEEVNTENN